MGNRIAKMLGAILKSIEDSYVLIDKDVIRERMVVYRKQKAIREYCKENDYKAFVANGSILPRNGDPEGDHGHYRSGFFGKDDFA